MVFTAGANPVPHTSCVIDGTVYYGANNQVLCTGMQENPAEVANLEGHIEALCEANKDQLLVGTASGNLYLVNTRGGYQVLDQLTRPITCVASNGSRFVAGCMDGLIHIYRDQEKQSISITGFALCTAFCEDLLVIGGTSCKLLVIHLPTLETVWLEGHEGWVRSLAFRKDGPSEYTLASGSQEKYIRLWKFAPKTSGDEDPFSNMNVIKNWGITFEALLMGHDDWVVGVSWDSSGQNLLSASSDSSLIIWMAESSDLWTPDHRLGDVSNWGASTATGTSGGFWAALWLDDGSVATVTRTGSFRSWQRDATGTWQAEGGPTGHFRVATDVAWFRDNYLLTTSNDQTTRLWLFSGNRLVEIGRPQIHGYDMVAVAPIDSQTFLSAGDEKLMRVFSLPRQVAEQMAQISNSAIDDAVLAAMPLIAGVPALGLSNKSEVEEEVPVSPREDHLQRLTLWPEADKLYGHGYEISCLAVSHRLGVIVSCSRANTEQHARIKFFSIQNYHEITRADESGPCHSLTVSRLVVSPDGARVISVSRDRKFMITDIATQNVEVDFPKAHTRIIWDAAWISDTEFITGSRDKQVKKWSRSGTNFELLKTVKFANPVTAVAAGSVCIAVGEEDGRVSIWDADLTQEIKSFTLPARVNRLAMNIAQRSVAAVSGQTVQVLALD